MSDAAPTASERFGRLIEAVENIKRAIDRHDGDYAAMRLEMRDMATQITGLRAEVRDIKDSLKASQTEVSSFVSIRERFHGVWWVLSLSAAALLGVFGPMLSDAARKIFGK